MLKKHSIQPYVIIMHSKYFNILSFEFEGGKRYGFKALGAFQYAVNVWHMQYTNKYSSKCFILKAFTTFIMNYIIYIILLYAFLVLSVVGSVGRSVGLSDWPRLLNLLKFGQFSRSDRSDSRFGSVGRIFTSGHPWR